MLRPALGRRRRHQPRAELPHPTGGLSFRIDMETAQEGEKPQYLTPDELWAMTFAEEDTWRDRFAELPFEDKGGSHPARYFQDIAVERAMKAIADNKSRILLTLATGTGKTFIAPRIHRRHRPG